MCTISYVPVDAGSFILTSNRDERTDREKADPPAVHTAGGKKSIWPTDGEAGGTWIAITEEGIAFALMNDYQSSIPAKPPFTSRGKIIPAVADCKTTGEVSDRLEVIHEFRFQPFRLLMASVIHGVHMWHFDGTRLYDQKEGFGAGIWVSAGEKERQVLAGRKKRFETHLLQSGYDNLETVKRMHTTRDIPGEEQSFLVELESIHTVSTTIAEYHADKTIRMHYMDTPFLPQKKWQICTV